MSHMLLSMSHVQVTPTGWMQGPMGDIRVDIHYLNDAMEEDGSAEEEDLIVGQVLDELGIGMSQDTPVAPMGSVGQAQEAKVEEKAGK